MLFHLLAEHINIFRYLSFRSIGAAVTGFMVVLLVAPYIIAKLREMKFGQQIREEGPSAHIEKTGTPTMGGLFLWGAVLCATLLWGAWNGFVLIVCLSIVLFSAIGIIDDYAKIKQKDTKGLSPQVKLMIQSFCAGVILVLTYLMPQYHRTTETLTLDLIDQNENTVQTTNVMVSQDWAWTTSYPSGVYLGEHSLIGSLYNPETGKINRETYFKIPLLVDSDEDTQFFTGKVVTNNAYDIVSEITRMSKDSSIRQSTYTVTNVYQARLFQSFFIPMYTEVLWYWPIGLAFVFFIFIIVGVSNAANLSDGLDGLATGMGIALYLPFGVFAYLMGHIALSGYLFYPFIAGISELTIFIAASLGAFAGFLWYNVHPAEVFMGDTGSLPMGAAIATIAIMLKQEMLLVVAGFMFVLETVSVILQILCYKKYKKRLFKMAPIHHHFELIGWKENQVVVRFWIMSAFCAILALATIKIR